MPIKQGTMGEEAWACPLASQIQRKPPSFASRQGELHRVEPPCRSVAALQSRALGLSSVLAPAFGLMPKQWVPFGFRLPFIPVLCRSRLLAVLMGESCPF